MMVEKRAISYVCKDAEIGGNLIKGCGHEGVSRIGVDLGKLAWKVEFAARWAAYDIRFEAYGKDIMDSVHVNDWVAENILGYAPPHHVKYEMFLDRRGKKISKSLGNVITSQRWLKYGTKQSLLLLLYKRITGARELGFEDIPSLMDEYHELEMAYFSDGGKWKCCKRCKDARFVRVCKFAQGTICSITACKIHATSRASTHICRRPYRASHQETLGL